MLCNLGQATRRQAQTAFDFIHFTDVGAYSRTLFRSRRLLQTSECTLMGLQWTLNLPRSAKVRDMHAGYCIDGPLRLLNHTTT